MPVAAESTAAPDPGLIGLPDMSEARPSQPAMKATLQAYVDRMNAGDADGMYALFAPGATMEDPIGAPLKRGEEILALFRDGVALGARLTRVTPIRGSFSNEAALVFEVEYSGPNGERLRTRSIDACTFDAEARIVTFRAFWGPDDVEEIDG